MGFCLLNNERLTTTDTSNRYTFDLHRLASNLFLLMDVITSPDLTPLLRGYSVD